jgi:hypothetical protein
MRGCFVATTGGDESSITLGGSSVT